MMKITYEDGRTELVRSPNQGGKPKPYKRRRRKGRRDQGEYRRAAVALKEHEALDREWTESAA